MTNGRNTYNYRKNQRPKKLNGKAKWALVYLGRTCIILAFVVAYFVFVQWRKSNAESPTIYPADDLKTVVMPANTASQIIDYDGFTVSFNAEHHVPNYVAWQLTKAKANGKLKRRSDFAVDPNVRGSATLDDYRRSGYDRGHMAPAGDMKWSETAMIQCHYLTNIVPQEHYLNKGVWNALEQKTREWVMVEDSLIVITGPVLTDDNLEKVGHSGVTVPRRFFKIIMAPKADPVLAVGFLIDNRDVEHTYDWYTVNIDSIESITGMDFFSALPDDVEDKLERSRAWGAWNHHMKMKESE